MKNLKNKVALLLAFVMMFALVPMNVFGSPINATVFNQHIRLNDNDTAREVFTDITVHFTLTHDMLAVTDAALTTIGGIAGQAPMTLRVQGVAEAGATEISNIRLSSIDPATGLPATVISTGGDLVGTTTNRNAVALDRAALLPFVGQRVMLQFDGAAVHRGATFEVFVDRATSFNTALETYVVTPLRVIDPAYIARPVAAQGGFSFTAGGPNHLRQFPTGTYSPQDGHNIAQLRITERQAGNFTTQDYWLVRLEAPAGYRFFLNSPSLSLNNVYASAASDALVPVNGFMLRNLDNVSGINENDPRWNRVVTFEVSSADFVGDRVLPGGAGQLNINGLRLVPQVGQVVFARDLPVRVDVSGTNTTPGSGTFLGQRVTAEHFYGSPVPAVQSLVGIQIAVAEAVNVRTGVEAGVWTAPITIYEMGVNTFLDAISLTVTIDNPDVVITGARFHAHNQGNREGGRAAANTPRRRAYVEDWNINAAGNRADFTVETRWDGNLGNRRAVEIELQLASVANHVGRDVPSQVLVNVSGVVSNDGQLNHVRSAHVANLFDPIELSATAPANIPFGIHVIDVAMNNQLADVTLTETAAGRLAQGSEIDVFLVPTFNGVPLNLAVGIGGNQGMVFNTTRFLEGDNNLRLRAAAGAAGQITTGLPEYAIGGIRFIVERASTGGPGSVTFTNNTLFGPMWNMPGIAFEFVVGGRAVSEHPYIQTPGNTLPVVPMPYSVIVAQLYDMAPPVGDDTRRPEGEGGPGTGPVVTAPEVYHASFFANALNENGVRAITTRGGEQFISLRFFADFALVGGNVNWVRQTQTGMIAGDDAQGRLVTMEVTYNTPGARVTIGGETENRSLPTMFVENETFYVPISAIQHIFGFSLRLVDGVWYVI